MFSVNTIADVKQIRRCVLDVSAVVSRLSALNHRFEQQTNAITCRTCNHALSKLVGTQFERSDDRVQVLCDLVRDIIK